jgi:hypothetical protein
MLKEEMRARAEEMAAARNEQVFANGNCSAADPWWHLSHSWGLVPNRKIRLYIDETPTSPAEGACLHCGCADKKDLQLFSSVVQVCAGCGQ